MSFWGLSVKPGKKASVNLPEAEILHLSQVCLHDPKEGKNYLQVEVAGTTYTVACLEKGKKEHDAVDLFFGPDETKFINKGQSEIHLIGYLEPQDDDGSADEEPKKAVKAASPALKAASPKTAPAASPAKKAASPAVKAAKAPVEESDDDDDDSALDAMLDEMEEGEEESDLEDSEEEAPPAKGSPKRKGPEAVAAPPAKKAKTDDSAKPSGAEAEYVAKLVDFLKKNGKTNLGALGSKVPRPKECPKMKAIMEKYADKFKVNGEVIEAK